MIDLITVFLAAPITFPLTDQNQPCKQERSSLSREPKSTDPTSEPLEDHVAISLLQTVVPEQQPVLQGNLLRPLHHQSGDFIKIPIQ